MEPRLKAEIWVKAHIRRCWSAEVPAMVVRRGDETAGTVLLKLNRLDGSCIVLAPARQPDGSRMWLQATGPEPVPEADGDAYIARELRRDPDLWVIVIEDRAGRHFLDVPVV